MPFNQRSLCASITLTVVTGFTTSLVAIPARAQLPQYSCHINAAGDGWECESTVSPEPGASLPVIPRQPVAPTPAPPASTSPVAVTESAARPDLPNRPSYPLDWVPREALTDAERAALPEACCGAFIDLGIGQYSTVDPAEAETVFTAPLGLNQVSPSLLTIDGKVLFQQGYRTIQNDGSTGINRDTDSVLLEGNVVFREPGVLLEGTTAYIDNATGINRVESAQYVLHEVGAHGTANSIVYNTESGLVTIDNGEFSRCEPESDFWFLRADQIVLNQAEGRGYATAVSLRVKDVPIFYYPYTLPFPLGDTRVSGLLAPSAGSTRSGGFEFELPYYFNLAPHYDATLSPRLISDRGVLVGGEARYLASWSMNTLNAALLSGDKLYDEATAALPGSESPPTEKRWFVGFEHFGALGANWSTYIDYNAVSDVDYFHDFGSGGLNVTSRTHLNRQARLDYNSQWLQAGLNAQQIEIIDPLYATLDVNRPYDRLPQFHFASRIGVGAGFHVGLSGEMTAFDRNLDSRAFSQAQRDSGVLVTGERINLEPELGWATEAPGWFVRATAKLKHSTYSLTDQAVGTLEDPETDIPVYSLDSGLVFERERRGGGTQTLEPRLFYLFSDYEDQSQLPLFDTSEMSFSFNALFREDRFSGGDRTADADQATLALTTRLLDAEGKERLRLSLGQILYFADRLVSLSNPQQLWAPRYAPLTNRSALAGEVAWNLTRNWRLNSDVQWNEDRQELDEGSLQLRYQRDNSHLLNLGLRYRELVNTPLFALPAGIDPRIKQSDVSGIWPLNANWKLLARWNYDHSNDRNLETFGGIEYSNCCATLRLIAREWVDEDELFLPNIEPNRGIFVQFTLNGLGNITGGGVSGLLRDGIWGFRETEYE